MGPQTRRLAEAHFEFDDLGLHDFKGKAQPTPVARLRAPRSRQSDALRRFGTGFVGRQAELGALLGAAEKMRDGLAQAVAVVGEAGGGKTRLASEFRARAGDDLQWAEGRAYLYAQNIAYAPLIDLLARQWSIDDSDPALQVRAKLQAGAEGLLPGDADSLPLLPHLFHQPQDGGATIERESFPPRFAQWVRQMLEALARRGPVVVCLQDLHWIDPSTDALLRQLVTELPGGVMLLVNFRPGYEPPPAMQRIALDALSPRQTRELLASLLGADPPEALTRFVTERCDGNPFYVEEVVQSLWFCRNSGIRPSEAVRSAADQKASE